MAKTIRRGGGVKLKAIDDKFYVGDLSSADLCQPSMHCAHNSLNA